MAITEDTVAQVAKLASLELNADEKSQYTQELAQILSLVDQLNQLDLSQVEAVENPVTAVVTGNGPSDFRIDEPLQRLERDALMSNAPDEEESQFRVPKILG